jgi:hypothetical protein
VAPLNPEHLFEQALKLTEPGTERLRQADLRRAISSVVTTAQDAFTRFRSAPDDERAAFVTLLLFRTRTN